MCGIAGFFDPNCSTNSETLEKIAITMSETMNHRGPDDSGLWYDETSGIGLSHRRLSIIDLSSNGKQPMTSSNGRYVIIYNGEIYNATELKNDLIKKGAKFRSESDTEVILEGVAKWGLENLIPKLIGMFAFAIWDKDTKNLYLVRDRLGIKPLYWGKINGKIVFSSELKAITTLPIFQFSINRSAVVSLLRFNYVSSPSSIYNEINKVKPGTIINISTSGIENTKCFWDPISLASNTTETYTSEEESVYYIKNLLEDSIKRRMISDVPLGAFLSGGIDSSLVVAMMQDNSIKPINTFTVGFKQNDYNEAFYAKSIAKELGTNHTEVYLDESSTMNLIPKIYDWFDEPFADTSQIPTYLVSSLAKKNVTVALSGDGGDEVFGGYTRYLWIENYYKNSTIIPKELRSISGKFIKKLPQNILDITVQILPKNIRPPQFGERLHKLAGILEHDNVDTIYKTLISHWQKPESGVIAGQEINTIHWDNQLHKKIPNNLSRIQLLDLITYLPDDILTKVDRTSMAVSLEARVPLLDHRIVEESWKIPNSMKIKNGRGKWILRKVLEEYLPPKYFLRPKQGFAAPIGEWLRGPLKEWAEELLSEKKIKESNYLNYSPIKTFWEEHKIGKVNRQYQLWGPLMFQAWLEYSKK